MRKSVRTSAVALTAFVLAAAASVSIGQAASCSNFGKVKSQNSNTPVTVTFINKSGESRGVMWINFKGGLVNYANLNPGQRYQVNTFVTHPWVFTDGPGNCVEMFMPRKGVSRFNITRKSTGAGGD